MLVANIKELYFVKSVISEHIPNTFQKEMAQKSIIVPVLIQLTKVWGCCRYSFLLWMCTRRDLEKAGIVNLPVFTSDQVCLMAAWHLPLSNHPGAHVNRQHAHDHMKNISVPFGGEQLICWDKRSTRWCPHCKGQILPLQFICGGAINIPHRCYFTAYVVGLQLFYK